MKYLGPLPLLKTKVTFLPKYSRVRFSECLANLSPALLGGQLGRVRALAVPLFAIGASYVFDLLPGGLNAGSLHLSRVALCERLLHGSVLDGLRLRRMLVLLHANLFYNGLRLGLELLSPPRTSRHWPLWAFDQSQLLSSRVTVLRALVVFEASQLRPRIPLDRRPEGGLKWLMTDCCPSSRRPSRKVLTGRRSPTSWKRASPPEQASIETCSLTSGLATLAWGCTSGLFRRSVCKWLDTLHSLCDPHDLQQSQQQSQQ